MHYVFVYGTLKRGFGNHLLLRESRFVANICSPPCFEMFSVSEHGGFPCLVDGEKSILGELYQVDDTTLGGLDALEGVPHMYERRSFFSTEVMEDVYYYHWVRDNRKFKTNVRTYQEPACEYWNRA